MVTAGSALPDPTDDSLELPRSDGAKTLAVVECVDPSDEKAIELDLVFAPAPEYAKTIATPTELPFEGDRPAGSARLWALDSCPTIDPPLLSGSALVEIQDPTKDSSGVLELMIPPPSMGAATEQWVAGALDPRDLSWADDDAARRAVTTRNVRVVGDGQSRFSMVGQSTLTRLRTEAPEITAARPALPLPAAPPSTIVTRAAASMSAPRARRRRPAAATSTPLALAIAILVFVAGTTLLNLATPLWPTVQIETDPAGAKVIFDGKALPAVTPVTLKVKPFVAHVIQLEKEGFPARVIGAIELGLGDSPAYSIRLERVRRIVHVMPSQGEVFINSARVGTGTTVMLPEIDLTKPVQLKVVGEGNRAWVHTFEKGADIPASLDVPLPPN